MSWTYNYFRDWLPLITLPSALRLRRYVLDGEDAPEDLTIQMRGWGDIHLRGLGGGDYRMFADTFQRGVMPPVLPGCETVIDLGGNIGLATIALARRIPSLRSYVVEPDRDNVRMLGLNLAPLIDAGRCRVEQGAMWKANAIIEVQPPPLPGSFGAVRCVEEGGSGHKVQGMTMDTILDRSGFDRIDMVKIDVEGAEAGMFDAGSDWLDRVGAVAIEFHGDAREASDFDQVAARHGMTISETDNRGVVASRPGDRAPKQTASVPSEIR